jgi:LPXTG-motif cell wall-anchored protein
MTQQSASGDKRVDLGDIKAKFTEIDTEVRGAAEIEGPSQKTTTLVAVGAGVVLIVAAFMLGRRRGRRKSTWVEIRRL